MSDTVLLISDDEGDADFLQQQDQGPLTAWACPHCTVENQPTYLACECCGQERPSSNLENTTNQLLDSQPTQQQYAPSLAQNGTETWTCSACTFINSSLSLDCDVCGTPIIPSVAATAAPPVEPTNVNQQQLDHLDDVPPPLHIPLNYEFDRITEEYSQKVYNLDCCCCGPIREIKEAVRVAVVKLPSAPTLLCMLRHFSCPANTINTTTTTGYDTLASASHRTTNSNSTRECTKQISRRDLEALLGGKAAAAIDRGFYSAALAASSNVLDGTSTSSVVQGNSSGKLHQQCMELATAIQALFTSMTSTTTTAANTNNAGGSNRNSRPSKKGGAPPKISQTQQRGTQKKSAAAAGVGYGGGRGEENNQQHREAAAARQRTTDTGTGKYLHTIRSLLEQLLEAEINFQFVDISPIGWLPLGAVGLLKGSPLAACLRLLLCNDSLMDVTERKDVYSEALKLVTMLASRQELIPLLLVPADGDILAEFASFSSISGNINTKNTTNTTTTTTNRGREGVIDDGGEERARKRSRTEKETEISFEADLERSCWKALQAFSLQCSIFMKSAQQLAGEGNEEDMSTVATVILVEETCSAVDQAVNAYKKAYASTTETVRDGGIAGLSSANHHPSTSRGDNRAPTTTNTTTDTNTAAGPSKKSRTSQEGSEETLAKQQYSKYMKELAFKSTNLVEGGDYYFRSKLASTAGQVQGDGSARLRRVMRDISSLSTDLPVDWNSSVLILNDDTRMDAFRAVIFPPEESPYSNGAFFFDILLPPEYPNSPPKVQFLTTGGGRIRFNPNLYDSGKVCLSLLGTWAGPSWDPKESSLLQVLVSIQAMILGEAQPYGNEPGFEKYLNKPEGKLASDAYNRMQRYNTVKYSILPAVQAFVAMQPKKKSPTKAAAAGGSVAGGSEKVEKSNRGKLGAGALGVPKGFEEALKLHFMYKSGEIQRQLTQWRQENATFNSGAAGGSKNKNHHSMMRMQGNVGIADAAMDEAVDSVLHLLS